MGGKPRKPIAAPVERRLANYWAKRHFELTPEPRGGGPRGRRRALGFVVQKHAARRLHYDFRLEHESVLLSWSVPRGPSLVPGERRLAVRTEDHPIEYADFEGIIPEGEYGGGTVIVWDQGRWEPDGDPAEGLARGRLTFRLEGGKLAGAYHLVKTRGEGKQETWLLIKRRDEAARASGEIVDERPESVVSGRSLEEVAEAHDRVWHSNRPPTGKFAQKRAARKAAVASGGAAPAEAAAAAAAAVMPARPDLTTLVRALPADLPFTNLDKVLYPEQGLSKADLIAYLAAVSDWILPHLGNRPLTLVRCPEGRHKQCFYQKHPKAGVPPSVLRIPIEEDDGVADYMMVRDLPGLLAVAQLGALELHTWGCHTDDVEKPDLLVFDLDPDPAIGWDPVVDAARALRRRLEALGLESFVKTTGGKGLHVCAPIRRTVDWDTFKGFSRAVVERMAAAEPRRFVTTASKAQRAGKIFLDYLRNGRGATFIAPYSPRAREGATVATPIGWDELDAGVDPARFTVATVPRRLGGLDRDPWATMNTVRQTLGRAALREVVP
jgi:bifunctional non-homologous end joining protein LigD